MSGGPYRGIVEVVETILEREDRVVVVEFVISCPRGRVRGKTNIPPLSLLEGTNGDLRCAVEEWVAEGKGGVDSCGRRNLVFVCLGV